MHSHRLTDYTHAFPTTMSSTGMGEDQRGTARATRQHFGKARCVVNSDESCVLLVTVLSSSLTGTKSTVHTPGKSTNRAGICDYHGDKQHHEPCTSLCAEGRNLPETLNNEGDDVFCNFFGLVCEDPKNKPKHTNFVS